MGEKSLKIKIVFPGKIKNSFAKDGFNEYVKRCNRFHKTEIVSLPASRSKIREKIIKEESERLIKHLQNEKYILLDVSGQEKNTLGFSKLVKEHLDRGDDLIFVVGGVFGVSDEVKRKAEITISLSRLTFTHSLSLVILAEQLYRAIKIVYGQSYNH